MIKYNGSSGACSIIYDNGTDIGIGTASPSYLLHLYNTSGNTEAMTESTAGSAYMGTACPSGSEDGFVFNTDSSGSILERWEFGKSNTSESGSNAGSDFFINRYADGGAYLSQPFVIKRSTGYVGVNQSAPSVQMDISSSNADVMLLEGSATTGTWLDIHNSSSNAHNWSIIAAGSGSSEGTGSLLFRDSTDKAVRMMIDSAGRVAIGTTTSSSYTLLVNGKMKTTGVNETSDERMKTGITTITDAIEKVLHLRGAEFFWRTADYPQYNFDNTKQIGLIAQEVEKVLPEVVQTDDKGYKAVDYTKIIALLIEGMKEQEKKIDKQQKEIDQLLQNQKQ